jgi:hypothetical protein
VEPDDGVKGLEIRGVMGVADGIDIPVAISEIDISECPDSRVMEGNQGLHGEKVVFVCRKRVAMVREV